LYRTTNVIIFNHLNKYTHLNIYLIVYSFFGCKVTGIITLFGISQTTYIQDNKVLSRNM